MNNTCKNCNTSLIGEYCHKCSQPKDTHRINIHFLWHDIQHGLLHIDKGILYTARELFTRPGHTIRAFLEGKRVQHFKPLSLVIVLAGVYGFLSHYFHINMLANNISVSGSGEDYIKTKEMVDSISEWLATHYSIFAIAQIPVYSIATFLAFRKAGYNFIEHLVLNMFLTGQRLLLHIFAFPLYYAFNETPRLRTTARVVDIIGYLLMIWAIYQLFHTFNIKQKILRIGLGLLMVVLMNISILLLIFKVALHSIK